MPARTFVSQHALRYLIPVAAIALVLQLEFGLWAALPGWMALALIAFAFRDPGRQIPSSPLGVVSAADGRVTRVDSITVPRLDREMARVTVNINPLGTYIIRSPIEGKTMDSWRIETDDGSGAGKCNGFAMWLETDEGDDVVLALRDASPLLRPVCTSTVGDRLGQGQRCGYAPIGSRIDVMMPVGTRIEVKEGARLRAGSDVIATLLHK